MLSVFIDTILICTATALMCLCSGVEPTVEIAGAPYLIIFIGAGLSMSVVWDLADVLMGSMAIINIPAIIIVGKVAIVALNDYAAQRKAGKNPTFRAATVGLEGKTDYWQD